MKIPLKEFEQHIDETILKRGLTYFKNGNVLDVMEMGGGCYEAVVEGTEEYSVSLEVKDEIIIDYSCSCPYDSGVVCKHVVAVIFYLQQEALDLEMKPKKNKFSSKKKGKSDLNKLPKKKPVEVKIDELLGQISHDELKEFVRSKGLSDKLFRDFLFNEFVQYNKNESQEFYAKQIKNKLLKKTNWGYPNGYNGSIVDDLLKISAKHFENRNYQSMLYINFALLDEMNAVVGDVYYNEGDIYGDIEFVFKNLVLLSKEDLPEEIRLWFFNKCIEAINKRFFFGNDWAGNMFALAANLLKTKDEANILILLLDRQHHSEHFMEELKLLKLVIILKFYGDEDGTKFIEENLSYRKIRQMAIEKSIEKNDYNRAISLAKDGIERDKNTAPGYVADWVDNLYKIAILQDDKSKIIEYARKQFIDVNRTKKQYYDMMKSTVESGEWKDFVEELINDIGKQISWVAREQIPIVFIYEEYWERLFDYVKKNPRIHIIEQFEKYLIKDYRKELADLYEQEALSYLNLGSGRNHYQTFCHYLRHLIKLSSRERVDSLIAFLQNEYKKRPALLEELRKV